MRTVSFSPARVRNTLNENLVNTFTSTEGDPTAGESIRHRPNEPAGFCVRGNGQQNVQTIFMTPDGDIFHAATGFLSSDDLLAEADFALHLFQKMQQDGEDDDSDWVVEAHRERMNNPSSRPKAMSNPMQAMLANSGNPNLEKMLNRGGSGSRNNPNNLFQQFTNQQFDSDNQFSINHPLMNYRDLEQDPTRLVGSGKTFFSSSSSNSRN